jgi:anti-sigma B factor antagonist
MAIDELRRAMLEIDIQTVKIDTAVIVFTGPLTLGTSLQVADTRLQKTIDGGYSKLVVNLANVPFVDSAGLGTLVHASGLAKERGGMLRLCCVNDRIASLLRMTLTDGLLPVDPDANDSLAALP